MSDGVSVGTPPATTLRLTSLCQIACSSERRVVHSLSIALTGLLLRCNFAARSESTGCACARSPLDCVSVAGPLLASTRRAILFLPLLALCLVF